jgi:hypothetical protein
VVIENSEVPKYFAPLRNNRFEQWRREPPEANPLSWVFHRFDCGRGGQASAPRGENGMSLAANTESFGDGACWLAIGVHPLCQSRFSSIQRLWPTYRLPASPPCVPRCCPPGPLCVLRHRAVADTVSSSQDPIS